MSSFFFHTIKDNLDTVVFHLYEITKIYDKLVLITENITDIETAEKESVKKIFTDLLNHYQSKIDDVKIVKENIIIEIQEICDHTYINDTVDSGLDNSINITYCTKCQHTKE